MTSGERTSTPLVSVVIPTNNRKAWVTEALESVFRQTFKDYEVIVVDDGSSDGTSEYLKEKYGDRLKVLRTEGTNCPTAKNLGASEAVGKYIAFLDDDDLWYPEKTEKQVKFMESADASVAMVGSACDHIDKDGKPFWIPSYPDETLSYEVACIKPKLPGASSGCLIRRSAFLELGGFDTELTRNQDREFWIRLTRSYKVMMLPEILSTVRIHGTARRGVNTGVIEACRLEINRRIPEAKIRRKANAWTYFHLFNLNWKDDKIKALCFLVKSFVSYPFFLPIKENRIKMAVRRIGGQ